VDAICTTELLQLGLNEFDSIVVEIRIFLCSLLD
jgi:hypothetical protein